MEQWRMPHGIQFNVMNREKTKKLRDNYYYYYIIAVVVVVIAIRMLWMWLFYGSLEIVQDGKKSLAAHGQHIGERFVFFSFFFFQ